MILVDYREGKREKGKQLTDPEIIPIIKKIGVSCEKCNLEFGDFYMEGNGPNGKIDIGVERKTIHDMLGCIEDSRYIDHQRRGMAEMYDKCFLLVEGMWRPHEDGTLMEGYRGGSVWGQCKFRANRVMYSKLRRYLFSVSLSGVVVLYSRDIYQTAYDLCELYHYFRKPWGDHTSLLETHKLVLPDLNGRPTLRRKWAASLSDIGTKLSLEAEKLFADGFQLASSDELDWMKIRGIGAKTARSIVKEIRGR